MIIFLGILCIGTASGHLLVNDTVFVGMPAIAYIEDATIKVTYNSQP